MIVALLTTHIRDIASALIIGVMLAFYGLSGWVVFAMVKGVLAEMEKDVPVEMVKSLPLIRPMLTLTKRESPESFVVVLAVKKIFEKKYSSMFI